jgi:histidinol-phosphate aminotransferase
MKTLEETIDELVRPEIRALAAYHVTAANDLIKLDAMENPWSLSAELRAGWLHALQAVELNRYPDPVAHKLQAAMRVAMDVPAGAAVILGNGSDELIQMIIQTVAAPGRVVLAPDPTFVMYRQIATVAAMDYVAVPLRDDFTLDGEVLLTAVVEHRPVVTFVAFPNNPTGNLFDAASLRALLSAATGLVVIDEAYAPFTDASFMADVGHYDNLLVLRTVSKLGLAGVRLGLLAGPTAWLEQIDKTRLPYNISVINQVTGHFALTHGDVFTAQAQQIRIQRARLGEALRALEPLTVFPSEANFILFRTPAGQATIIHEGLKSAGILIKNLNASSGPLRDCLRVTVGLPQENEAFLAALRALL